MNNIRNGFIAAMTLFPIAIGCERSEPTPSSEEPGMQTRSLNEADEREGTRGAYGTDEGMKTNPGSPGATGADRRLGTDEPSSNKGMTPGAVSGSVDQITQARCAREQRCENIGTDKKFASMEACTKQVRNEWQDELDARECPGGIVQKELSECLDEIRNEDCGAPFDTLSRVVACRESDICKALGTR